jgi:putative ABC transport system substrate-binding protein
MNRRHLIALIGGAALCPTAARAQQPPKTARVGVLRFGTASAFANRVEALRAGLRDLGYVEGRNLVMEFRWADTVEQLQEMAADLVATKVDVIFATASTEVEPARRATQTIPIVFATHSDPITLGHVASLPRPGGNITGLSMQQAILAGKQLEILKQTVPHATRFGMLWSPTAPSNPPVVEAAGLLAINLVFGS